MFTNNKKQHTLAAIFFVIFLATVYFCLNEETRKKVKKALGQFFALAFMAFAAYAEQGGPILWKKKTTQRQTTPPADEEKPADEAQAQATA